MIISNLCFNLVQNRAIIYFPRRREQSSVSITYCEGLITFSQLNRVAQLKLKSDLNFAPHFLLSRNNYISSWDARLAEPSKKLKASSPSECAAYRRDFIHIVCRARQVGAFVVTGQWKDKIKYIEQRPSLLLRCGERNNKGTGFELAGGLHVIYYVMWDVVYMAEQSRARKIKTSLYPGACKNHEEQWRLTAQGNTQAPFACCAIYLLRYFIPPKQESSVGSLFCNFSSHTYCKYLIGPFWCPNLIHCRWH